MLRTMFRIHFLPKVDIWLSVHDRQKITPNRRVMVSMLESKSFAYGLLLHAALFGPCARLS